MKRFVEVHYRIKDGKRDAFYRALQESGIPAASRTESGNEKYEYYFNPENENELLLLEIWTSPEAAEQHMQTTVWCRTFIQPFPAKCLQCLP